ncbi:beta-phosphoglucomutase [Autumnicola musiva]|uniref:Beta-phosphoglucomutase n=1 Tax=Autumnicola musiva TaxID=3075589 RepID=A0ABU3DA74_9FLAO|nr:beta-phosphoglucomutase [Zunongwangia sp. F117]MDT0678366.1 beta-phosphoglucomutase [Zunongwangia sp. F117]
MEKATRQLEFDIMEKRRAVIFDLDGIIVDTTGLQFRAWKKVANDLGCNFSEEQNEQLKGISREDCLKQILSWGQLQLSPHNFQHWMQKKNDYYLKYVEEINASAILPGVQELINSLDRKNIPYALGSASRNAGTILRKLNLVSKFSAVVDGNDVNEGKPDPGIFLLAAQKLNCSPLSCVVFEDSIAGIKAANRAGMISIGIGKREILSEADYVFKSLQEVTESFLLTLPALKVQEK